MSRERVTITIRNDLLSQVDRLVDGINIRSRSQAMEYLLSKFLSDFRLNNALILAGGPRKELLVNRKPKFLLDVNGKSLLRRVMDGINEFNVGNFIVYVDSFADEIAQGLGNSSPYHVEFLRGKSPKGTVAPLRLAKQKLNGTFLLAYGDTITNLNINDMLSFHRENNAIATIALTTVSNPKDFGVAVLQGNKVTEFEQKPKKEAHSFLVNAGYFIFEPEIFRHIGRETQNIEKDLLPKLAAKRLLYGYPFQGKYFNVNSKKDLAKARAMV